MQHYMLPDATAEQMQVNGRYEPELNILFNLKDPQIDAYIGLSLQLGLIPVGNS